MESDPADTRIALLLVDWTFGTEPLSAMAPALRQVTPLPVARLHPETVSRLKLADDEPVTVTTDKGTFTLPLQADANMAPGVMVIPRHHQLDWQIVGDTRVTVASSQLTAAK